MTEEGGDTEEQFFGIHKKSLRRRPLWSNLEKWVDEEPSASRARFEDVKSALLIQCEYLAIVYSRISNDGNDDPNSLNILFNKFVKNANETSFLSGTEHFPPSDVFLVISDIFSTVPEFKDDKGNINGFLREKLSQLLDSKNDWAELHFDADIVRSVYWQLCFTLRLAPVESEGETESTMAYDDNRAKLMFGSFIVAILVSIGHYHDTANIFEFSNFLDLNDVSEHITCLITSENYRTLAQFFLVGMALIIAYGACGNNGTTTLKSYSADKKGENDRKFQESMTEGIIDRNQDFVHIWEDIKKSWETLISNLLKHRLITSPESSKLVQKSGRPRKSAPTILTRKRKTDDPLVPADLQKMESPQQSSSVLSPSFPKKERIQKSPKKQRDLRKKRAVSPFPLPFNDIPSTSAASAPKPRMMYPTADDVGLVKPIYVRQADILTAFREEIERRKKNGSNRTEDAQRVNQLVFESYDEIHLLNQLVRESSPRSMKAEQAAYMQRIKKKWRRGNSEESDDEEEHADDKEEEEEEYEPEKHVPAIKEKKAKVGKRPSKKWKRQY